MLDLLEGVGVEESVSILIIKSSRIQSAISRLRPDAETKRDFQSVLGCSIAAARMRSKGLRNRSATPSGLC